MRKTCIDQKALLMGNENNYCTISLAVNFQSPNELLYGL